MASVMVGHPDSGFSGYLRVAGRGLLFTRGFTELVDLTAAQQTALTSTGFTVDGQPDPPVPDPFPQYLTEAKAATAIGGTGPLDVALRAAFGAVEEARYFDRERQFKAGGIGIGDKAAVALTFSDWEDVFADSIVPLLLERGLPAGYTQVSRPHTRPGMCEDAAAHWARVSAADGWARRGIEFWNHSATHTAGTPDLASITDEIVTAKAEIVANTNGAVKVAGFLTPGCGVVDGVGITTGGAPLVSSEGLYETLTGRVIMASHGLSRTTGPGMRRPLPTGVYHGLSWQTIGEGTVDLPWAMKLIDELIRDKRGTDFAVHPGNIVGIPGGQPGAYTMTLANLISFLDYLVAKRAAGLLEVVTPSGLFYTDHTDQRINLEPRSSFEDVTTGDVHWSRWASTTVETDGGHTGARYLRVSAGAAGVYRVYDTPWYDLRLQGEAMCLKVWCRANGGSSAVPRFDFLDPDDNTRMNFTVNAPAVAATWQQVHVPFSVHPEQMRMSLTLRSPLGATSGVDYDDLQIVKV